MSADSARNPGVSFRRWPTARLASPYNSGIEDTQQCACNVFYKRDCETVSFGQTFHYVFAHVFYIQCDVRVGGRAVVQTKERGQ